MNLSLPRMCLLFLLIWCRPPFLVSTVSPALGDWSAELELLSYITWRPTLPAHAQFLGILIISSVQQTGGGGGDQSVVSDRVIDGDRFHQSRRAGYLWRRAGGRQLSCKFVEEHGTEKINYRNWINQIPIVVLLMIFTRAALWLQNSTNRRRRTRALVLSPRKEA